MTRLNSNRARRLCLETHARQDEQGRTYMPCHISGLRIYPERGDKWEAEHLVPVAMGGSNDASNIAPAMVEPHRDKTKQDVKAIAKVRRAYDKRMGVRRPKRPMHGSRASGIKKHMDGRVSRR